MENRARVNVALLAACQALLLTSATLVVSTTALVGLALAPDPSLATVPVGLQFLGTMATAVPASLLMRRVGRRVGLMIGATIGIAGALLCTTGIVSQSFACFAAGTTTLGIFNCFGQFYRFAAADAAPPERRSQAIALVMAGGVVAAFTGPNLARATRNLVQLHLFAGSYASLIALYLVSIVLLSFVSIPRPAAGPVRGGHLGRTLRDTRFLVAVYSAMVGYGVMNLLMTATPLAMLDCGYGFGDTAFVIQWHVLGMFVPSFFTGRLIQRFGVLRVMMAGAVLLGCCAVINLSGIALTNFWTALALLGVGWNFMFVGATTLVVEITTEEDKARTQGLNDLLVFGTVALTGTSTGALHHLIGWSAMNAATTPFVCAAFAACWWLLRRMRRPLPASVT